MKKILFAFGILLLSLAACTQFEKETVPNLNSNVTAPFVVKAFDADHNSDSSFMVKITPGTGNNYYTFAVIKGEEDPTIDAETLLTLGYLDKCVTVKLIREEVEVDVPLGGCFSAADQKDTVVFAFDLVPDTDYTVYAVGNDNMGMLSKVTALTIKTTDKDAPVPTNSKGEYKVNTDDLEEGTIVITFDDNIELTDAFKNGSAKFYAHYLGANDYTYHAQYQIYMLNEVFVTPVPVDSVSVDGKNVSIQVPERIPGAVVGITYDADVVKNPVKLSNEKLEDLIAYWDDDEIAIEGIGGRFETAEWEFSLPMIKDEEGKDVRMPADTVIYFNDWTEFEMEFVAQELAEPKFQAGGPFNFIVPAGTPQIRYTDSANRRVINDVMEPQVFQDTVLVIWPTEAPDFGSSVSVDIAKGDVEDLWGNPCAEFTTFYLDENDEQFAGNYFCSYGYEVADIVGTYEYQATSYFGADYNERGAWVIEESNNAEKGNVMITTIFDYPCKAPIYCDFDPDGGKLTIPDGAPFYDYEETGDHGTLVTAWNGTDFGTFTMKMAGVLTDMDNWFGYYGKSAVSDDKSGWWNVFTEISAQRTGPVPTEPSPITAPKPRKVQKSL